VGNNPQLIKDCGKNENEWSGLALGIGLDRAVMVKKNISDIRVYEVLIVKSLHRC
jgi:phenylalanyl-tRNA synthetase alpha chain